MDTENSNCKKFLLCPISRDKTFLSFLTIPHKICLRIRAGPSMRLNETATSGDGLALRTSLCVSLLLLLILLLLLPGFKTKRGNGMKEGVWRQGEH